VHLDVIDHLLRRNPETTAKELQTVLSRDLDVYVTIQTVSLIRRKLGWTTKK
jgi:transposase